MVNRPSCAANLGVTWGELQVLSVSIENGSGFFDISRLSPALAT